jgi:hypothetical protein
MSVDFTSHIKCFVFVFFVVRLQLPVSHAITRVPVHPERVASLAGGKTTPTSGIIGRLFVDMKGK